MQMEELRILLLCILGLPVVAAAVVAALGSRNLPAIRWISLGAVILNLVLTGIVVANIAEHFQKAPEAKSASVATFEPICVPGDPGDTHKTRWDLLRIQVSGGKPAAIQFYLGLDGLNIWLVALTSLLMLPSVLVSWHSIRERGNEFYAWLLVLQAAMTGVFLAFDIILFYVFFELTLVPLFFLIGIWGGPARREAARKFFLFTLAGSLITLLGMIGLVITIYQRTQQELTFSIPELVSKMQAQLAIKDPDTVAFWRHVQIVVFLALSVGFAVKVPLFPLHTWLPLAHVEAPTAGSVLLAGVLLKLGTYGFLRLCLPLTPDAALSIGVPLIGTLSIIGIVYGALCAYAQDDIKKMVAYSSVSHLGFCMLGLFSLNAAGIGGSLMQMVNHGLSTGGLFLLVGVLYERYHTRMMKDYGGLAARLKVLSLFMVMICLSSVGLPFLNGFVGEMLVLGGTYDLKSDDVNGVVFGVAGAAGIVLGAWYLFTMLQKVFFGQVKEPGADGHGVMQTGVAIGDLTPRELAAMVPLGLACLLIGICPQPMLLTAKRDVDIVARISAAAWDRAHPIAPETARNDTVDEDGKSR